MDNSNENTTNANSNANPNPDNDQNLSSGAKFLKHNKKANIKYISLFIFNIIVCLVFMSYGQDLFKTFPSFGSCDSKECYEKFSVLRTSFVQFSFNFVIGLWCLRENLDKFDFHGKKWGKKFVLMILLFVVAFLIPNKFFIVYAHIIRILAGVFIVCQILAYLETAHLLNERWLDSESKYRHIKPLVVSLIAYVLTIVGLVFMYKWYKDCDMSKGFIVTITFLCILFFLMSLVFQKASLLISAIMSVFIVFYTHGAFISQPDDECNKGGFESGAKGIEIFISIIIIVGSLILTVKSTVLTPQSLGLNPKDKYNYVYFHIIMSLGMSYATMVLISWSLSNTSSKSIDNSWISFWVKIVSALFTAFLYLISLISPVIFKNREFDRKKVVPMDNRAIP